MTVKGIQRLVYNKGKKCNIHTSLHSLKKYKGMEPTFKLVAFYNSTIIQKSLQIKKEKIFFNNENDKLLHYCSENVNHKTSARSMLE